MTALIFLSDPTKKGNSMKFAILSLMFFTVVNVFAADRKPANDGLISAGAHKGNPVESLACANGKFSFKMHAGGQSGELHQAGQPVKEFTCTKPAAQPHICCDFPILDFTCNEKDGSPDNSMTVSITSGGFAGITTSHLSLIGVGGNNVMPAVSMPCHPVK